MTTEQMNEAPMYFNSTIMGELSGINCWVAGGAIRDYFIGITPIDYDIYFPNEKEFKKAKKYLENNGAEKTWESGNGVKYNYKGIVVDLVKIYSPSPEATIENFDFTCCMLAIKGYEIFYGETTFKDLYSRKLIIYKVTSPLSTLKRTYKYIYKGFTISAAEAKKLYEIIKALPYQYGEGIDYLNADGDVSSSGESQSGAGGTGGGGASGGGGGGVWGGGQHSATWHPKSDAQQGGGGSGGGAGTGGEILDVMRKNYIPLILAGTTILLALVSEKK